MTIIADILYIFAALAYLPILLWQMIRQKKNRRGWSQRFGNVQFKPTGKPRIWIHAVSLGEINATPLLVEKLKQLNPEAEIVVSTTTDTGYARACKLYDPSLVFRYPLDFSWIIRKVLNRIQPDLIVLVELEVWYNLLAFADKRGIPIAVVNGRLTERSCKRFGILVGLGRAMFRRLSWVGSQDKEIADRFKRVGVLESNIEVMGSVKWDTAQIIDRVDGTGELAASLGITPKHPMVVFGSTGHDEEPVLLEAWKKIIQSCPDAQLAIIPRKPERFDQVAGMIRSSGFNCLRRSENQDGSSPPIQSEQLPILLGDTMGELRKFYCLASAVFVGRSLVDMGGSDPIEVSALAKPVVVGPYTSNFVLPVRLLREGNGLMVNQNGQEVADTIIDWLKNPETAQQQGQAGRQVVLANQGATEKAAARLTKLLQQK